MEQNNGKVQDSTSKTFLNYQQSRLGNNRAHLLENILSDLTIVDHFCVELFELEQKSNLGGLPSYLNENFCSSDRFQVG